MSRLETTIVSQYYFKSSSFVLVILCFYLLFESLFCMGVIFRVRDEVGFPWGLSSEVCLRCRRHRRPRFDPWVGKKPWRRAWQPTPVFLPGDSHGRRSLVGYSLQGHKDSDMNEVAEHRDEVEEEV